MRRWRVVAPLIVAAGAVVGACTQVSTSPTRVAALEFDSLPYPSIVTGDSMRDSTGKVSALHAVVFNGTGGIIANPSVQYIAFDTGLTIGAGNILTAQARNGSVRLIAQSGGLESRPLPVLITRRPDSVIANSKLVDTLSYDFSLLSYSNKFGVKLATNDTAGGVSVTQGWLVSYQLFYHGKAVGPNDSTVFTIVHGSAPNFTSVDTTAQDGTSGRRVRLRLAGLVDTTGAPVTVVATVRYKGVAVRGSPVTFVLYPVPKPLK